MNKFLEMRRGQRRQATDPELVVTQERRKNRFDRRSFIKLVTAGASSVVLEACGGGSGGAAGEGGSVTSPLPVTTPTSPGLPVWSPIPTLTFVQGVPSSISIAGYVSNATNAVLALAAGALPPGVTFNATKRSFDYDGSGAVGSADGFVLTAKV
ncbi:hypothetical protein [Pseudoduganella chitinolytica]|uniref:Twin-arginine translocation signal domain-containing protein n=1 Tax=Pseudoduganella chitinolytica TaxID=34070 RepID=A0ABY8B8U8_9BURK|nr:hypothetical protein [Pseudoduganella chitinolytica]WEF32354.1 hypothetical protein PX653_23525 [Pseudoduganella chitinolytica]